MKKIVSITQPYDRKQNIYIYEDGNQIFSTKVTMDDLPATVLDLSAQYDVINVTLFGSKQFNRGLAKKIKEAETEKYVNDALQITVR